MADDDAVKAALAKYESKIIKRIDQFERKLISEFRRSGGTRDDRNPTR